MPPSPGLKPGSIVGDRLRDEVPPLAIFDLDHPDVGVIADLPLDERSMSLSVPVTG